MVPSGHRRATSGESKDAVGFLTLYEEIRGVSQDQSKDQVHAYLEQGRH